MQEKYINQYYSVITTSPPKAYVIFYAISNHAKSAHKYYALGLYWYCPAPPQPPSQCPNATLLISALPPLAQPWCPVCNSGNWTQGYPMTTSERYRWPRAIAARTPSCHCGTQKHPSANSKPGKRHSPATPCGTRPRRSWLGWLYPGQGA